MTAKLNQLFSNIVSLNVKSLTYISNDKNNIESWIATLSELELGEAAKQIFITLLELRGLDCTDLQRYQIMQKIEPNLLHLLSSLEQHYLSNSLLDTKRDQQISDLVLEIKSHHALLYYDIVVRTHPILAQNRFSFFEFKLKKKMLALRKNSTALALKKLTNLLYSCQLLYIDVPKNFWVKSYTLYNLALGHQFSTVLLDKQLAQNYCLNTIEKIFIQLILLSILNSHKLRPSEIKDLMQCISSWTHLVKLTEQAQAESKFVVELSKDNAPKPLVRSHEGESNCIFIAVSDLVEYLEFSQQNSIRYHSSNAKNLLPKVLKHHIQSIITLDPTRILPRHSEHGMVKVVLGIISSHFYLSQATAFKETLEIDNATEAANLGDTLFRTALGTNSSAISKLYEKQAQLELTRVYQADVLNRSDTGYGLLWHNQLVKNLRTGEFILIKSLENELWQGAMIRWMKNNTEQLIEFGVEIVARQMCPLAIKLPSVSQSASSVYHPCVLSIHDSESYQLILPSGQLFQENQNLVLRYANNELKIFLKKSTVLTQSCAIFDFEFIEHSKKTSFDEYLTAYISTTKTQNLWETLK